MTTTRPPKETISYDYDEFAEATGLSRSAIEKAVLRGDLEASYYNSKPLIEKEEGRRWVRSLPKQSSRAS